MNHRRTMNSYGVVAWESFTEEVTSNCVLKANRKSLPACLLSVLVSHYAFCPPLSSLSGLLSGSTFKAFAHAVSFA